MTENNGNPFRMDAALARRLMDSARSGNLDPEFSASCDADERDHIHVGRVGAKGSGLEARALLITHEGGRYARLFLAAPRLRQLAAALLNVADEIDGETRLNFMNPDAPSAEEPE